MHRMPAAALLLLAAAVLLGPSGPLLQPASAQGLGVAPDLLGAGAQATATAFEDFQDVLNLATVGGRGRGTRCAICSCPQAEQQPVYFMLRIS